MSHILHLLEAFAAGGLTVWAVYHFGLQPALRNERDVLAAKLKAQFGGGDQPKP